MEYNVSATKYLFWFVEIRETARLLGNHIMDEISEYFDSVEQRRDYMKKLYSRC